MRLRTHFGTYLLCNATLLSSLPNAKTCLLQSRLFTIHGTLSLGLIQTFGRFKMEQHLIEYVRFSNNFDTFTRRIKSLMKSYRMNSRLIVGTRCNHEQVGRLIFSANLSSEHVAITYYILSHTLLLHTYILQSLLSGGRLFIPEFFSIHWIFFFNLPIQTFLQ